MMTVENANIEFKEIWKDDNLKVIAAFANTNGGKLYIGINDDGFIVGIDNYKKRSTALLKMDLLNVRKQNMNFLIPFSGGLSLKTSDYALWRNADWGNGTGRSFEDKRNLRAQREV